MLPFAVGIGISPLPAAAAALMAAAGRRTSAVAFLVGWLAGLGALAASLQAVIGLAGPSDAAGPDRWAGIVEIVLAALLLRLAAGRLQATREREPQSRPAWLEESASFPPGQAVGTGFMLALINPKNLAVVTGMALVIAVTDASAGSQAAAVAVGVLIGGAGILGGMVAGVRGAGDELGGWAVRHNSVLAAAVAAMLASVLAGYAIVILTA